MKISFDHENVVNSILNAKCHRIGGKELRVVRSQPSKIEHKRMTSLTEAEIEEKVGKRTHEEIENALKTFEDPEEQMVELMHLLELKQEDMEERVTICNHIQVRHTI